MSDTQKQKQKPPCTYGGRDNFRCHFGDARYVISARPALSPGAVTHTEWACQSHVGPAAAIILSSDLFTEVTVRRARQDA